MFIHLISRQSKQFRNVWKKMLLQGERLIRFSLSYIVCEDTKFQFAKNVGYPGFLGFKSHFYSFHFKFMELVRVAEWINQWLPW